jgi:GTPase SAR1 family protein
MPITNIIETKNDEFPKLKPIAETMDKYIPNIINGVPNKNGFIWVLTGSGGSGKTSLMLNFFKSKELYRCKFDNVFYICPMSSFLSVEKHPFIEHTDVYHELTVGLLEDLYERLCDFKNNEKKGKVMYNCIIIDDFADSLKNNAIVLQLNKMLIKARHIRCSFIFTLQSYYYFPKILRKQITNITIFQPKNVAEWDTIASELLNLNKDDGLILYNYVFNEPYNHLDIDTSSNINQKNFNILEIKQ